MNEPVNPEIRTFHHLKPQQCEEVRSLCSRAVQVDKVEPVGEAAFFALNYLPDIDDNAGHAADYIWLLAYRKATKEELAVDKAMLQLVGVAVVERASRSTELVVDPVWRRRGVGQELFTACRNLLGGQPRIWAHGGLRVALNFAENHDLDVVRQLHIMYRDLTTDDLEPPVIPSNARIRPLNWESNADKVNTACEADLQLWLKINSEIFAHYPEQGRLTRADLEDRLAAPWFSPQNLIFIEVDNKPIGFGWIKVDPHIPAYPHAGELYVVGIIPAEQGHGWGRLLSKWMLYHLAQLGCTGAYLYVDGANYKALHNYERLGLRIEKTDFQFA